MDRAQLKMKVMYLSKLYAYLERSRDALDQAEEVAGSVLELKFCERIAAAGCEVNKLIERAMLEWDAPAMPKR